MRFPPAVTVVRGSVRAELRPLAGSALLGVAGVALNLARPWPLARAIDAVVSRDETLGLSVSTQLTLAGCAVVALTGIAGWVDMRGVVAAEGAAERAGAALRAELFDRSIALSPRWHDRMRSGELASRLTSDVGRVLDALVAVCSTALPDVVRLAAVLVVLLALSPQLALVALAVVPVLAALALRQRRLVRGAQTASRAESGRFTATAVDLLRNVRAVQAFGRGDHARTMFGRRNRALLAASSHAVATEARWAPIADITLAAGSGLVLVIGGRQALSGSLSAGDLVVITTYASALYSPVRGLSRLSGVLAKSTASALRLTEVLDSRDQVLDRPGARPAPQIEHEVRMADVTFGYGPGCRVLDRFNLVVRAGETVCLLGPSGIGKSTILHLLLRLYDVGDGAVLMDGVDVRDLRARSLRQRIAFVPQEPWLLDTTIADNIAFGVPGATRHGIARAAQAALVDEFADRLPHGYETEVGEGATRLSGGQRRRIALARAALSDAPLVLLDEPTASLDPHSAAAVVEAIRRATANRTVLLVTHDPGLAQLADRAVRLDRADTSALRLTETTLSRKEVFSHDHDARQGLRDTPRPQPLPQP